MPCYYVHYHGWKAKCVWQTRPPLAGPRTRPTHATGVCMYTCRWDEWVPRRFVLPHDTPVHVQRRRLEELAAELVTGQRRPAKRPRVAGDDDAAAATPASPRRLPPPKHPQHAKEEEQPQHASGISPTRQVTNEVCLSSPPQVPAPTPTETHAHAWQAGSVVSRAIERILAHDHVVLGIGAKFRKHGVCSWPARRKCWGLEAHS
jgi:hypothetical protein